MSVEIILHDGSEPVMLRYGEHSWDLCWQRETKNKEGEQIIIWTAERFYANPSQALTRLLEMKVGHSNAKTLNELAEAIENARKELIDIYGSAIKVKEKR